jgi:hypothetical protein
MKMNNVKLFGIGVLTGLFFIFPSLSLADGGEPGAMCPGCEDVKCQYVAPPYIGSIRVEWKASCTDGLSNCLFITGSVEMAGKKPKCPVIFDSTLFASGSYYSPDFFQNFKPYDLKGSCLIHLKDTFDEQCNQVPGFPELVAVGNLEYGSEECQGMGYTSLDPTNPFYERNCLTANAVIMIVFVP